MKYIIREMAYCLIMIFHRIKSKKLIVQFRAKASLSSRFEGCNKLSHHSHFSGEMGFASYIGAYSTVDGKIGKYCSIADRVAFLVLTHPIREFVSTHPCFYSMKKQSGFTYAKKQLFNEEPLLEGSKYSIDVGNDVYIGYGATIIGPCRIGDGAVIAAGAVVTEDVLPYTIVGGVPAKFIRYRFTEEKIEFLMNLQWWNKPQVWIEQHKEDFISVDRLMETIDTCEGDL